MVHFSKSDDNVVTLGGAFGGTTSSGPRKKARDSALRTQLRVIFALMLHDIKSRFFGNGLGYIATILWPGTHITVIISIYYFLSRPMPYGNDRLLYASISALPYIMWSYIGRFTIIGMIQNKQFLNYPIVKPLDIMFARECLELMTSFIIAAGLLVFLLCCGSDPFPYRKQEAAFALLSAALLGMGFGVLGGVITMIFPLFAIFYVLLMIVFWVTSGVAIDPESLPSTAGYWLSWNPLMHSIEWMRYAYYNDFPAHLLDKTYVIYVGVVALALGLILERVLRVFTTQ